MRQATNGAAILGALEERQRLSNYGNYVTQQLIREYAHKAEKALQVLSRLTTKGPSEYLVHNIARLLFGEFEQPEDDADIAKAPEIVNKLMELFLLAPSIGDTDKRDRLKEIIVAAEIVLGVSEGWAGGPALDLNLAGTGQRSAFTTMHPDDVPPELRDLTYKYWEERQSLAALEYAISDVKRSPAKTKTLRKAAIALVDDALARGAFIKPYAEMGHGQRQFWMQRAAGIAHKDKPPKIDMRRLWQTHEAQQVHLASLAKKVEPKKVKRGNKAKRKA